MSSLFWREATNQTGELAHQLGDCRALLKPSVNGCKAKTLNELADLLEVTVEVISNYENGVSSPKEAILFKIIEVLGCDANYIFQDAIHVSDRKYNISVHEYSITK